jgi:phosphoribosylpyrophosphate synthetase
MAVPVGGPRAPRSSVRARGRRPQRAASAAVVLVVPGFERFVDGLGRRFFTRSMVRRFPNGELHTEVPDRVEGCRCVVVGSISPPAGNLERLTLLSHTLRRAGAARVTALLPYLAYARQDRAARSESLGLAWVGELLRASGVDEIVCVDAPQRAGG